MSVVELPSTSLRPARFAPPVLGDLHGDARRPDGARSPSSLRVTAFAAVVAGAVAWGWLSGADARALRALPPEARQELLERTEANLRDLCLSRPERPHAFCRGQAELLASLEECQGACLAAAREELRADSAVK